MVGCVSVICKRSLILTVSFHADPALNFAQPIWIVISSQRHTGRGLSIPGSRRQKFFTGNSWHLILPLHPQTQTSRFCVCTLLKSRWSHDFAPDLALPHCDLHAHSQFSSDGANLEGCPCNHNSTVLKSLPNVLEKRMLVCPLGRQK